MKLRWHFVTTEGDQYVVLQCYNDETGLWEDVPHSQSKNYTIHFSRTAYPNRPIDLFDAVRKEDRQ